MRPRSFSAAVFATVLISLANLKSPAAEPNASLPQNGINPGLQSAQEPKKVLTVDPADGLTLGKGFSFANISPAYPSPFQPFDSKDEMEVRKNCKATSSLQMYAVTSTSSEDECKGLNVEAKARYLFAKGESNLELSRRSRASESTFRLVMIAESAYGDDELAKPKLNPAAESLIKQGKMQEFASIYGTHYVGTVDRVSRVALTISIDQWSDSTVNALHASLGGGASLPIGGGSLKLKILADMSRAAANNAINVDVKTVGGEGIGGFGEMARAVFTNNSVNQMASTSNDFMAQIGGALKTMMAVYNRDNAGIGSVTVYSYKEFGWDPSKASLWNDLLEQNLQTCAALYYKGAAERNNIENFRDGSNDPILKQKLDELDGAYTTYLTRLASWQKSILAEDGNAVKPEGVPAKPALDADIAEMLFAQSASVETRIAGEAAQLKLLADDLAAIRLKNAYYEVISWGKEVTQHDFTVDVKFKEDVDYASICSLDSDIQDMCICGLNKIDASTYRVHFVNHEPEGTHWIPAIKIVGVRFDKRP